jgi:hypothetical protein
MTDTDTTDQVKRLRIKVGMIRMGERIAFGSDADALDEAADTIERLTKERDEARAAALEEAAKVAEQKFRIDQNRRDRMLDEEWEQDRETAGDEIAAAIRALEETPHD